MTINFDLTNSVSAQRTAKTKPSYGGTAHSVVYSADNDENDDAIIAAGIARIGDRPLLSLQRLDDFLAELDAEDDTG